MAAFGNLVFHICTGVQKQANDLMVTAEGAHHEGRGARHARRTAPATPMRGVYSRSTLIEDTRRVTASCATTMIVIILTPLCSPFT